MSQLEKHDNENEHYKMSLSTLEKYFNALNDNDLEGVLSMIHRSSPAQMPTRQILGQLMNSYTLNNVLLKTNYIGADNDYIYVRMKQKIIKLEGPEFKNNISDSIIVLKQDEDAWKIWSMMSLVTDFI